MKIDHPSFFYSLCSIRADVGSPPADEPSSLSGFAGNAFVLPGEPGVSLNGDTPRNNKPALSSIVGKRRTAFRNSGNKPHAKTKMAPNSCQQSEAMLKISNFVELPIVCEALLQSPKLPLRASPFLSLQKADMIIVNGVKGKISPSLSRGQGWVKLLSTLQVGLFF